MASPDEKPWLDLRSRPLQLALLAAATLAWGLPFAAHTARWVLFEDAMIVMRYARNLAAGDGFVFNLGERILGVTTPLQTLLSTLFFFAGAAEPPVWQNYTGLFFLVAEAFLLLLLARRLGLEAAALPVALLALGGFFGSYLYVGMETHLFMALALAALLLDLGGKPRPILLGVALGFAFLTRYDAALLAGLLGLAAWQRERAFPWRTTLAFFAVAAPWLLFAQLYFGSILPQPLAAKESYFTTTAYLGRFYDLWREDFRSICQVFSRIDIGNHLVAISFPLWLAAGAFLLARRGRRFLVPAIYPLLHLAVYAGLGPDPAFNWHVYLLGPFSLLFGACLIGELLAFLRERLPPRLQARLPEKLTANLLVLALLGPLAWHLYHQAAYRYQPDPHTQQLRDMGRWIGERYPPSTSLMQPSIGLLGYESNLYMVDHAGLVTPGLYFWNDQQCTPVPEVLERFHPDLVLLSPWSEAHAAEMVAAGYAPVHTFEPYSYTIYQRAGDRPAGDRGAGGPPAAGGAAP